MSRILRFLPWVFMALAAWLGLQACSTMEGKLAPPLVNAEIVGSGPIADAAAVSAESWRLLAFFGPN
jgi:hypothetical protein